MTRRSLLILALCLSAPAALSAQGLAGLKFCIDPGHGGHNAANDRHVIPNTGIDFWESESNFQKALLLKALLEQRGATVLLTRYTNDYPDDSQEPSLTARVALANANNVDWFHSIHSNATGGTNTSTNNTLVLVREKRSDSNPAASTGNGFGVPERQESWTMSGIIGPSIKKYDRTNAVQGPFLDWTFYGGANDADHNGQPDGFSLGVLRGLLMPGELSEGSFHDYYPETRRLMNNDYRENEAYAIMRAFEAYFGGPVEPYGIVAGIQTDNISGLPKNGAVVRLLPDDRVYHGDSFNNGYYRFDSLAAGQHWVRFETPGYRRDSVSVAVGQDTISFVDRTLTFESNIAPFIVNSSPKENDTGFPTTSVLGVQFSDVMDTASVRAALSLSPPFDGVIYWTSGNKTLLYDPRGPLPAGTLFTFTIDTTARSLGGPALDAANLGHSNAFIVHFTTAGSPDGVDAGNASAPAAFGLRVNYPNPFNPTTTLRYGLSREERVTLRILDLTGRTIATLVEGSMPAGEHAVVFEARDLPSGVYLAELLSAGRRSIQRLMLIK